MNPKLNFKWRFYPVDQSYVPLSSQVNMLCQEILNKSKSFPKNDLQINFGSKLKFQN